MVVSRSEGGGCGAADAGEQVVELGEFLDGEVEGAGEAVGQVGDALFEGGAGGGGADPDGAFVVGAAFAGDVALVFEAFEQGREGAAVEVQGGAEVADGEAAAVPDDA